MLDGSYGLSNNTVTAVLKDKRGLMWVGTQNGLNLYAGYHFIHPFPELNNLSITELTYDSVENIIWIGTTKGLYAVNADKGQVNRISQQSEWGNNEVTALAVIQGKGVMAMFKNGFLVNVTSELQSKIFYQFPEVINMASQMLWDGSDRLLFFAPDSLKKICAFNLKSKSLDYIPAPEIGAPYYLSLQGDTLIYSGRSKTIVFQSISTGNIITPDFLAKKKLEHFEKHGNQLLMITCGSYCSSENYYSSVQDTVLTYDLVVNSSRLIPNKTNVFFGRQRYNCSYLDEFGIIWVGTNQGLFKINPPTDLFDTLLYDERFRISARAIIEEPNGDLYVGGSYGLFHYSVEKKSWQRYLYLDPETRDNAVVTTDMVSVGKYIYISSHTKQTLFRFDKDRKKFELDIFDGLPDKRSVFSLYLDKDSLIWVGSSNGLMNYDPKTRVLQNAKFKVPTTENCPILDIKPGSDDQTFWVATNCGLYQYHRDQGIIATFDKNSFPALSSNDIYFVEEDSSGYLWVTTNGAGINLISPDRKTIHLFNRGQNGLASDIVYGMLTSNAGNRWFSTSNGLSCYLPKEDKFYNYHTVDGLCNEDFNYNSYLKTKKGKMYFGTVNGVNAFDPEKIFVNHSQNVQLFVLPVSKWDEVTKSFKMISDFKGNGDEIILHSPNASLVFNLGMTDYSDPIHNTFTYRILGLFNDWIPVTGEPVLRLHGIPYGKYTVQIQGTTARGVSAVNQLHFVIHVKKPFYTTWWFYLIAITSFILLLSAFFWFKYQNLKKMQRLRLQISSNLHDEVGSLLTSITIFSDNLRFSGNTGPEKDSRLKKIAALSREATITMGDILWAVDARNDMPDSLSERIREYAEERLLPLQVHMKIDVEDISSRRKMPIELRQQLYLIFKESINNVIKHATATEVSIIFRYHNKNSFLYSIENDGAHNETQRKKGQGLKNMKMRAQKIGAAMTKESDRKTFKITVRKGQFT